MSRFAALNAAIEELNAKFRQLSGAHDLLPRTSLRLRGEAVPEAGFIRLVSWLWSLYHETGRQQIEALKNLSSVKLPVSAIKHLGNTVDLRTSLQHHLDTNTADNRRKSERADAWLSAHTEAVEVDSPDEWEGALRALCAEAEGFAAAVYEVLNALLHSDLALEFAELLTVRLERTVAAHELDRMIDELKMTYGVEHLDTRAFRDRYYQGWRDRTRLLSSDQDPRAYMRALAEQALSQHVQGEPAPLTGDEIIDIFGIRPGPDVGRLKRRAEELAASGMRSKRDIVEALADETEFRPTIATDSL